MLAETIEEWTQAWEQKGIEKGIAKGIEQGIEQGIEKGIEQGIEKGIEKAHRETIINARLAGLPVATIAQIVNMAVADIERIVAGLPPD